MSGMMPDSPITAPVLARYLASIMGSVFYPLSEQIKDTIAAHGVQWAWRAYCVDRKGPGLSAFEWSILSRG